MTTTAPVTAVENLIADAVYKLLCDCPGGSCEPFCQANENYGTVGAVVVGALTKAGYEIVVPVCDVAPKTVYMGVAYDKFETAWQAPSNKRVIVVERTDG